MTNIIVDYGVGNLGAIENIIRHLGFEAKQSSKQYDIASASHLILPGIGHFGRTIETFNQSGLRSAIETRVLRDGVPLLGICVGMQMLLEHSTEGDVAGLGWIPGHIAHFDRQLLPDPKLRVPHLGWSDLDIRVPVPLFAGLENEARFYFAHSFHAIDVPPEHIIAETYYGYQFPVAIAHDNIFGVQFHPEKSHRFGMTLFKNFLSL